MIELVISPLLKQWERRNPRIAEVIAGLMLEFRGRREREGWEPQGLRAPSPFGWIVFSVKHYRGGTTVYHAEAEAEQPTGTARGELRINQKEKEPC